ncbi:hypothetical protein EDD21DRAFT_391854 [Dissophora ornata]|nr:hypothetical protein EDD21DRAFT_391854 [Dissophora ornata]
MVFIYFFIILFSFSLSSFLFIISSYCCQFANPARGNLGRVGVRVGQQNSRSKLHPTTGIIPSTWPPIDPSDHRSTRLIRGEYQVPNLDPNGFRGAHYRD